MGSTIGKSGQKGKQLEQNHGNSWQKKTSIKSNNSLTELSLINSHLYQQSILYNLFYEKQNTYIHTYK